MKHKKQSTLGRSSCSRTLKINLISNKSSEFPRYYTSIHQEWGFKFKD